MGGAPSVGVSKHGHPDMASCTSKAGVSVTSCPPSEMLRRRSAPDLLISPSGMVVLESLSFRNAERGLHMPMGAARFENQRPV